MTARSFTARFSHTNIIAEDWRALADFYTNVFGCVFVPPARDYESDALDRGTGLMNARLTGCHLRVPGFGDDGPTLEIFSYSSMLERAEGVTIHRKGLQHIAFAVSDVAAAQAAVLAAGGKTVGEIVTLTTADGRRVTWCYVADIEGNVVELQAWAETDAPSAS